MRRFAAILAGGKRGRASLSALTACLLVGGCASVNPLSRLNPGPVDPNSAVAAQVTEATQADYRTPRFTDIPRKPTDARPPEEWRKAVVDVVGQRRPLTQWVAQNPPGHGGTDQFAETARASLPSEEVGAPPTDATQATEAFAADLRAQAAPPPPPQ